MLFKYENAAHTQVAIAKDGVNYTRSGVTNISRFWKKYDLDNATIADYVAPTPSYVDLRVNTSVEGGGYGTEGQRADLAFNAYEAEQGTEIEKASAAAKALYDLKIAVRLNFPKP